MHIKRVDHDNTRIFLSLSTSPGVEPARKQGKKTALSSKVFGDESHRLVNE